MTQRDLAPASIVIPTWRRRVLLRRLLFSIARQSIAPRLEVIVVDSDSGDGTAGMVARFHRRVHPVVYLNVRNAIATKRNAGAAAAHSDTLVFFDDDMHLCDVKAIEEVLGQLAGAAGPVCFRVAYPPPWCRRSSYYRFKQRGHERLEALGGEVPAWRFVTMAFAITRQHYDAADGFDEAFQHYGGEDHAFEFALRARGIVPMLSPTARIEHHEPSSTFREYRRKLVVTAQHGMPVLLGRWPGAFDHRGLAFMEGRLVGALLRVLPTALVGRVVQGIAALLDRLPADSPEILFFPLTRLYVAVAYAEGRARRGSS
jgi:glycosyltransferase involved in cell wall biosynthesis